MGSSTILSHHVNLTLYLISKSIIKSIFAYVITMDYFKMKYKNVDLDGLDMRHKYINSII